MFLFEFFNLTLTNKLNYCIQLNNVIKITSSTYETVPIIIILIQINQNKNLNV